VDKKVLISSFFLLFDCIFEAFLKQRQFRHEIGDCVHVRVLRRVVGGCLNADDEFVFEWVRKFVAGEENFWIFQQLTRKRFC
jgi:hypothetical protein